MKKWQKYSIIMLALFLMFFTMNLVLAATTATDSVNPFEGITFIGGSTNQSTSPYQIIKLVINAALGLVGALALLILIYGGALWMVARSNKAYIDKAKDTLVWATLGLVLIFGSYALTNYVFTVLQSTTEISTTTPTAETIQSLTDAEKNFISICEAGGNNVTMDSCGEADVVNIQTTSYGQMSCCSGKVSMGNFSTRCEEVGGMSYFSSSCSDPSRPALLFREDVIEGTAVCCDQAPCPYSCVDDTGETQCLGTDVSDLYKSCPGAQVCCQPN